MGLVMRFLNLPFPEAAKRVDGVMGLVQVNDPRVVEQTVEKKRDTMRDMFRESRPVQAGDPVHAYLTRRCGDPAGALEDLRFHPALWHKEAAARFPAMLAFMGWDPVLRKFSGIHRTYLTADGQKAPVWPVRKNFGTAGPVRLGPVAPRMGIAEGIETALCGSKLFGLPVWSGICAHGVETWSPPAGVEGVLILGDNDENYVGQAAANDLAKRLRALGLVVEVRLPPVLGQDWADVWALQQQEVA